MSEADAPRECEGTTGNAGEKSEEDTRFLEEYDRFGWCEKCGDRVPPAGAVIGFFGKQDLCPRWCRDCVIKHGDAELLEIWDESVNAETKRRADREAQKRQKNATKPTVAPRQAGN